jgi:hypothetical protein
MIALLWVGAALLAAAFTMAGINHGLRPKEQLKAQMPWTEDFSQGQLRGIGVLRRWEVRDRPDAEEGEIVWAEAPREGSCVEFVVIFGPAEIEVVNHPAARAMNSKLVGEAVLANGQQVFVV